jgi:Meiotically up-regulated gene 113
MRSLRCCRRLNRIAGRPMKYPASFTFLPSDFGSKRTDNSALLNVSAEIFKTPFSALEPDALVLGINKKSIKLSTVIGFGEIYIIWAVGTTLYKIGVSTDFRRRFKDLSSVSPLPLVPVKYARCDHPHLLESKLHELFAAKLFKNEWFSLGEADLIVVEEEFDRYFERARRQPLADQVVVASV